MCLIPSSIPSNAFFTSTEGGERKGGAGLAGLLMGHPQGMSQLVEDHAHVLFRLRRCEDGFKPQKHAVKFA